MFGTYLDTVGDGHIKVGVLNRSVGHKEWNGDNWSQPIDITSKDQSQCYEREKQHCACRNLVRTFLFVSSIRLNIY